MDKDISSRNTGETDAATAQEPRHTLGPWSVDTQSNGRQFTVRGQKLQVARTCITKDSMRAAEGLANARLISAAPDLLRELDQASLEVEEAANVLRPQYPAFARVLDAAAKAHRAVLAKATGQEVTEPGDRAPMRDEGGLRDEPLPPNPSIEWES